MNFYGGENMQNNRDNNSNDIRKNYVIKVVNGYHPKTYWSNGKVDDYYGRRNGGMEGVQSLRNEKSYVFRYDPEINDFIGQWIPTPDFVKKSLGINDSSDNTHDEH